MGTLSVRTFARDLGISGPARVVSAIAWFRQSVSDEPKQLVLEFVEAYSDETNIGMITKTRMRQTCKF